MNSEQKKALKVYRQAIRESWLPVVGRDQLSSAEYDLIAEWFGGGIALDLVLRAIRQCAERAQRKHITIVSLGVVRADLVQLQKKKAGTQVGAHQGKTSEQWRETWARDLPLLIEEYADFKGNEDAVAYLKQFQLDLPVLDEDQARARLHEFQQKF